MIQTRALLAREVATLITSSAVAEGNRLFDADKDAPAGNDLGERITRAQYQKRAAERERAWVRDTTPNEEEARATEAAIVALRAAQGVPG